MPAFDYPPFCCPQLSHPDTVEGLVLINIDPNAKGWMDWAAHKVWKGLCAEIQGGLSLIWVHLGPTGRMDRPVSFKRQGMEQERSCVPLLGSLLLIMS